MNVYVIDLPDTQDQPDKVREYRRAAEALHFRCDVDSQPAGVVRISISGEGEVSGKVLSFFYFGL
jgi:hypothetical protein